MDAMMALYQQQLQQQPRAEMDEDSTSDNDGDRNEVGMAIGVNTSPRTRRSGGSNHRASEPMQSESLRSCWICLSSEEDNPLAVWVKPCRCSGSTKWVHQSCLCRWIDEKQNGNYAHPVICQQCRTEYIIHLPKLGKVASALAFIDYAVRKACPFLTAGVFIGCIYWTALTYGAFTVLQVMGHKRGIEIIENWCPYIFVGLPAIPTVLIFSRLITWENAVMRIMRSKYNILRKLPCLNWLGEPDVDTTAGDTTANDLPPINISPLSSPDNIYRLFCGAMLLPSMATAVGILFFNGQKDPLQRAILGGITFILAKGLLKIYLGQKLYIRSRRRRILDFTDENVRDHMGGEIREAPAALPGN